ncbi:hypothetical protein [Sinomonas sp. ASV322]|uniref:hypothetical protein n=1 Tax=Sinomonas sp. ASV322 TaxID=3041920 RepID=UPI0027DDAD52|nr:hypothetical protein [Sinomonas sp. ASV322]MDQ4502080.1 hypothetical protein [Sinomonas sp. ASV322]
MVKLAWTDPNPVPDDALPAYPGKMVRLAEVQLVVFVAPRRKRKLLQLGRRSMRPPAKWGDREMNF